MNLHALAGPLVSIVNPRVQATVKASTGWTTLPSGVRVPSYDTVTVQAQVQPLTFRDIQQIEGLNLQGTRVGVYLYGRCEGLVRSQGRGGDLVIIYTGPRAGVYLVATVLEQWPDWVKVAVTLQNDPIPPPPGGDPSLDFSDPDNSQYLPGL